MGENNIMKDTIINEWFHIMGQLTKAEQKAVIRSIEKGEKNVQKK